MKQDTDTGTHVLNGRDALLHIEEPYRGELLYLRAEASNLKEYHASLDGIESAAWTTGWGVAFVCVLYYVACRVTGSPRRKLNNHA